MTLRMRANIAAVVAANTDAAVWKVKVMLAVQMLFESRNRAKTREAN